jgi:hypothetical protein
MEPRTEANNQIVIETDTPLNVLAAKLFPDQDVSRFIEILDLNDELDPLNDAIEGMLLKIPQPEQILNYAEPVLQEIGQQIDAATGFLDRASEAIEQFGDKLPPQLQGYTKQALDIIGQLNGYGEQAKVLLDGASKQLRTYAGKGTNLVQWLLGGKP